MRGLAHRLGRACAVAVLLLLGGCASVPPNAGNNPIDPFERFNRQVFAFNDGFDRAIATPVAKGYNAALPNPVRQCIGNFFDNLNEITSIVNSALQGKPAQVGSDVGRFLLNSTVGLFGCFDPASHVGLERNKQYFALTMGKWGVDSGPYLVLPFLGPSSVRDAVGEIPDYFTDPVSYITPVKEYYFTYSVRFVDKRARLLDASKLVEQAALDRYQFVRDAYLQRTRSRIYDGNPPPLEEEDPDSPPADQTPERGGPAPPQNEPMPESLVPPSLPPQASAGQLAAESVR